MGAVAGGQWLYEGGRSHERGSVTVSGQSDLRCRRCEMMVGAWRVGMAQGVLFYDHHGHTHL